ncbi:MAG: GGDEF domain-containing protein [Methylophilaceae bacterium]
MPNFDLRTIIFMSMLLTFMFSMILAITRKHHKEVHGPGYWAVGNLVVGLGMILVLMQLDMPTLFFMPGVALIGAGLGLYINGIEAFLGKTPDHRIPVGVFLLLVAVEVFFMMMQQDIRTTVVLGALIFSVIYLVCARLTFSKEEGVLGELFWVTSSLFLLLGLLMLARAFTAARVDVTVFDSFATWPVNAYTFMLGAVSQFFISGLFVLMLSYRLNQNLESMATIDGLTNILNRRGLEDAAGKMQGICKRINLSMAILLIDIDHFKKVNDRFGHLYGDEVLRHLAITISKILRTGDVLGRYGGEEFCVFLPNTTEQDALGLAERIRAGVEAAVFNDLQITIATTVSIGVADSVQAGYEFKGLVAAADSALYAAKNSGRNKVRHHSEST